MRSFQCFFMALVAGVFSFSTFQSHVSGQSIRVSVENLQPADGFYLTPVWVGFHDGSFDLFDAGTAASGSLEALAEGGDFSGISADFAGFGTDGGVFAPGGFAGAPVFDPGENDSEIFNVGNDERYFSFASMIIPSNDGFFANESATAYEIFDANGNFNGPLTITLLGGNLWDAGTEINDGLGAAFSTNGGTSTDENGLISLHPGLGNFLGSGTAAGTTIGTIPGANSAIARITITQVPEPASLGLIGILAGVVLFSRKRTRQL